MMEKRVLLAFLLSALFLAWYGQHISRSMGTAPPAPTASAQSGERPALPPEPAELVLKPLSDEESLILESASLQVEVGQTSGAIRKIVLKGFQDTAKQEPLRIGGELPVLEFAVEHMPLTGTAEQRAPDSAEFNGKDSSGNDYHISYSLKGDQGANIAFRATTLSQQTANKVVTIISSWEKADELSGQNNALELFLVTQQPGGKLKHAKHNGPFRSVKNVPRGTSWFSLSERYLCQSLKLSAPATELRLLPSPGETIAVEASVPLADLAGSGGEQRVTLYAGPRDYFYLKKAGFEGAFPIGILGQIGLALLVLLSGLSKLVHNYGLGIILFAGLVTGAMAPFTIMSYRSMKKMQELKPEMDRVMAKHKDDPKRAQQEVFALYKQHRVSPMSGCLPMLLQMPIFIALFQAISHYVELRGQGFLWIRDLSLPDRLAQLPVALPVIGHDLNVLPVVMAGAMFLQSRISQKSMPTDQNNPMAKAMSGPFMSIVFCFMFYQFPYGLVLYWLTNTLMSMLWYRVAR